MANHMPSVCVFTVVLSLGVAASGQEPREPAPVAPQQSVQTPQEQQPPVGVVDQVFVSQTMRHCRAEIELSKIALSKSVRPDVKMVAQRIVDDHTKMNAELGVIAQGKKMILPGEPAPEDKPALQELEKLTGDAFDRAYLTQTITSHQHSVDAFKEYSEKGTDALLKAWSARMLPALQQHMDLAREARKKIES